MSEELLHGQIPDELGELPPLGEVPEQMYASVIRQDRFGDPIKAFRTEVVDVPAVGHGQVLVYVMAAGIKATGQRVGRPRPAGRRHRRAAEVRTARGLPHRRLEGSGVVWAVGPGVRHVRPGDHVVLSEGAVGRDRQDIRLRGGSPRSQAPRSPGGTRPTTAPSPSSVWSTRSSATRSRRSSPGRPPPASCSRHPPPTVSSSVAGNTVRPGDPVLIWGGAGGLGSSAIQLTRMVGGIPIAVVSDDSRAELCLRLGAQGVINRSEFDHWGRLPDADDEEGMARFLSGARAFGKKIWEILGERAAPQIVFEHSGQATLPTSMYLCATGGMVVICGGTSGYNGDVDLRHLWMRSKRLQGSHGANTREFREVTKLVSEGVLDPCLHSLRRLRGNRPAAPADPGQHPPGRQHVRPRQRAERGMNTLPV